MRKLRYWPATLVAVLLVAGCATQGPAYSPPKLPSENQALLVIYKDKKSVRAGRFRNMFVDETKVALLTGGEYTAVYVEPGLRQLSADTGYMNTGQTGLQLTLEPAKVYYVKYRSRVGSATIDPYDSAYIERLESVSPNKALKELPSYTLGKVYATTVP